MTNPNTDVIHTGDSMDVLDDLPENSVHAVVTDPPYGLAFMGRDWDDFEPKEYQEWCEKWARKAKRVLKPGGHMLAFSGNRTHHRLFTGVEDAGFEIRDTITWHYGSGFPKALDVSKAIDKQADAERKRTGPGPNECEYLQRGDPCPGHGEETSQSGVTYHTPSTAPATDAAREWDGFKTALKPATEYVVVARKPLSEGTVAENVQTHGTGALNIDGTRVENDGKPDIAPHAKDSVNDYGDGLNGSEATGTTTEGRYPSNVVFDEQAAEALDRSNGTTVSEGGRVTNPFDGSDGAVFGEGETKERAGDDPGYGDSGGPSRYFYTSKATRAERTLDGKIDNAHPTVKPSDLMEWLVRLVTAEGQTVLDPFAGSGTTCRAAKDLGREFIGIEKQAKWADVARVRCGLTPDDPSTVRGDDAQTGIEAFD